MPANDERIGPAEREGGIEWRRSAACRDVDPEIFFPDAESDAERRMARAKAICARCPVREQCRQDAIERREPAGIWGGTTPEQRVVIRRKQRRSKEGRPARRKENQEAVLLGDRIRDAERGGTRSAAGASAASVGLPSGGVR